MTFHTHCTGERSSTRITGTQIAVANGCMLDSEMRIKCLLRRERQGTWKCQKYSFLTFYVLFNILLYILFLLKNNCYVNLFYFSFDKEKSISNFCVNILTDFAYQSIGFVVAIKMYRTVAFFKLSISSQNGTVLAQNIFEFDHLKFFQFMFKYQRQIFLRLQIQNSKKL